MGPSVVNELVNFGVLRDVDDLFMLHQHREVINHSVDVTWCVFH